MKYETILVKETLGGITITFNRLSKRNSINECFLKELNDVLNSAEKDPSCRLVVLEGQKGFFCTGMDFEEFINIRTDIDEDYKDNSPSNNLFMETIKRLTLSPKVIISKVDGQVMAGGIGITAASDLVIATPDSQFSLSEALWGLLPSMVLPYLIRRIGFQKAYSMTLTTLPVYSQEAYDMSLVDIISETPDESIRRLWLRLMRLDETTIKNMKNYFRKLWMITSEVEENAVSETKRLLALPDVKNNITNFVKFQKFPWENKDVNKLFN